MKPFRRYHFLQICALYRQSEQPLDLILRNYFRENSSVGSHDRKEICLQLYHLIRWQGLIDAHIAGAKTDEARLEVLESGIALEGDFAPHVNVSFPKQFYAILEEALGDDVETFCRTSNERAPVTLRANLLKTSRDELIDKLGQGAIPCSQSPAGIELLDPQNLFAHPLFKEGLFEVQDEASQIAANLLQAGPGDHVLDYCAGAGGKTLAFAHKLEGKGQIYLNDVRQYALRDAKKRLNRAGIQNATLFQKKRRQKMDHIFLDVPCTGTGTLRRNPDQKWRFSKDLLDRMVALQWQICEEAIPLLKRGGQLVYATCSVLPQENDEQIKKIVERFGMQVMEKFSTLPVSNGMDGFFACRLKSLE